MRIIFMGSPDFAVPVLDRLQAAGHDIACVYSQPPRRAGRGKKERPTPVQARATALGLTVRHPLNFKAPADQQAFAALNADIAVVVAYGLILPQALLDAPLRGCLNIHASLLPRWRGAAPLQRAIMAGDNKTGVCIMQMQAGLDTGAVLLRQEVGITPETTAGRLHDQLAATGATLIVQALGQLDALMPVPQADNGVTYAAKINKSEARIDWQQPAHIVDRQIRGLAPFPGAWCDYRGERLKLLDSREVDGTGAPGEILDHGLTVACKSGAVRVLAVQRSGKSVLDIQSLLRGFDLPVGGLLL